jgi:hypothetical protein
MCVTTKAQLESTRTPMWSKLFHIYLGLSFTSESKKIEIIKLKWTEVKFQVLKLLKLEL